MTSKYTPTTEQVREFWASDGRHQPAAKSFGAQESADEFDRWLAAHDAEVAAKALEDARLERTYEQTMSKVHRALMRTGMPARERLEAVSAMQNEGILFRERAALRASTGGENE